MTIAVIVVLALAVVLLTVGVIRDELRLRASRKEHWDDLYNRRERL